MTTDVVTPQTTSLSSSVAAEEELLKVSSKESKDSPPSRAHSSSRSRKKIVSDDDDDDDDVQDGDASYNRSRLFATNNNSSNNNTNGTEGRRSSIQLLTQISLCCAENGTSGGGKIFDDRYVKRKLLTEGSNFTRIHKCRLRDTVICKRHYIVKEIYDSDQYEANNKTTNRNQNNIQQEIACLKTLKIESSNPYVVTLLDFYTEACEKHIPGNRTYLVMDEVKGGTLEAAIQQHGRIKPNHAAQCTKSLVEAIRFCHSRKVIHRDIQPNNLLLVKPYDPNQNKLVTSNSSVLKVADFGCARSFAIATSSTSSSARHDGMDGTTHTANTTMTTDTTNTQLEQQQQQHKKLFLTMCGVPEYRAPEMCINNHGNGYDERCDIWSAGVVVYIMLCGYLPFQAKKEDNNDSASSLVDQIVSCALEFHDDKEPWSLSTSSPEEGSTKEDIEEPKSLIRALLTTDPEHRTTLDNALECEWLKQITTTSTTTKDCSTRDEEDVPLDQRANDESMEVGESSPASTSERKNQRQGEPSQSPSKQNNSSKKSRSDSMPSSSSKKPKKPKSTRLSTTSSKKSKSEHKDGDGGGGNTMKPRRSHTIAVTNPAASEDKRKALRQRSLSSTKLLQMTGSGRRKLRRRKSGSDSDRNGNNNNNTEIKSKSSHEDSLESPELTLNHSLSAHDDPAKSLMANLNFIRSFHNSAHSIKSIVEDESKEDATVNEFHGCDEGEVDKEERKEYKSSKRASKKLSLQSSSSKSKNGSKSKKRRSSTRTSISKRHSKHQQSQQDEGQPQDAGEHEATLESALEQETAESKEKQPQDYFFEDLELGDVGVEDDIGEDAALAVEWLSLLPPHPVKDVDPESPTKSVNENNKTIRTSQDMGAPAPVLHVDGFRPGFAKQSSNNGLIRSSIQLFNQHRLFVNDSAAGKDFNEVYVKQKILQEGGGFSQIFRCKHRKNRTHYVVKEIVDNEQYETLCDGSNDISKEIDAMKKLREGPYIVRLVDVFTEECDNHIPNNRTYMVMEEMKGGDLLATIMEHGGIQDVDHVRKFSRTLLEAIRYCHTKGIAHRDIKPENILFAKKYYHKQSRITSSHATIKLTDFGFAHNLDIDEKTGERIPNCLHTLCGTPEYVAPELYTHTDGYDERCDIWSAGIVIYLMCCGYLPFDAPPKELPGLIIEGFVEFHEDSPWKEFEQAPKDLILSLLQVNPDERATLEQALDCEWLQRYKSRSRHLNFLDKRGSFGSIARVLRMFESEDEDDRATTATTTAIPLTIQPTEGEKVIPTTGTTATGTITTPND